MLENWGPDIGSLSGWQVRQHGGVEWEGKGVGKGIRDFS